MYRSGDCNRRSGRTWRCDVERLEKRCGRRRVQTGGTGRYLQLVSVYWGEPGQRTHRSGGPRSRCRQVQLSFSPCLCSSIAVTQSSGKDLRVAGVLHEEEGSASLGRGRFLSSLRDFRFALTFGLRLDSFKGCPIRYSCTLQVQCLWERVPLVVNAASAANMWGNLERLKRATSEKTPRKVMNQRQSNLLQSIQDKKQCHRRPRKRGYHFPIVLSWP